MILLEAELTDVPAVRIHAVEHADDHAGVAGNALERRRGHERDLAARQIAGVVVVDVRVLARRDLPQPPAVGADLEHLPMPVRAGHGEEHAVAVEVEVDVGQEFAIGRRVQRGEFALGTYGRKNGQFVVPFVAIGNRRRRPRTLPRQADILGQAPARTERAPCPTVRRTTDDQQTLEVEQRIREQRLTFQRVERFDHMCRALDRGQRSWIGGGTCRRQ